MRITVYYMAQIKRAAGCGSETIEITAGTLREFLRALGEKHDATFRGLLLDDAGDPRKSLLFFVGEDHADLSHLLKDGDTVTVLAPMAGG
jgi:molybdopterin converting factor small subunit